MHVIETNFLPIGGLPFRRNGNNNIIAFSVLVIITSSIIGTAASRVGGF